MALRDTLLSLTGSYFHLVLGQKEQLMTISAALQIQPDVEISVKHIEGVKCDSPESLFEEFARVFNFPDYFGHNWAALNECLNDLDWLAASSYVLLISDLDKLLVSFDGAFMTFIRVLLDVVIEWTGGRNYSSFPTAPTPFHVVFHCAKEQENYIRLRLGQAGIKVDNLHIIAT